MRLVTRGLVCGVTIACQPIAEPVPLEISPGPAGASEPPEPPTPPEPPPDPGVAFDRTTLKVRVVARLNGDHVAELHGLADRRLFVSQDGQIAEVPAIAGAKVPALKFIRLPRVSPVASDNVFAGESLDSFGGVWPTRAIATTAFFAPRTNTVRGVFTRQGDGWRREHATGAVDGYFARIVPWTAGRALALRLQDRFSAPGATFTPEIVLFGGGAGPRLPAGLQPHDLATTADGDVFVLGARDDALAVVRWDAGGLRVADDPLPAFPVRPHHEARWSIVAADARTAYVGGGYAEEQVRGTWTPYFAALADGVWTAERTPLVGRVGTMALAADGSLWLTTSEEPANNPHVQGRGDRASDGNLWRRAASGGWSSVTLVTDDRQGKAQAPIDLTHLAPHAVAARGDALCALLKLAIGRDYARVYSGSKLVCTA